MKFFHFLFYANQYLLDIGLYAHINIPLQSNYDLTYINFT